MRTQSILLASLMLAGAFTGFAATKTWTGGGDRTSWGSGANWSGGAIPAAGDDVVINSGAGTTVAISSANVSIRSLQCTKNLSVTTRTLTLTGGASQISGALTLGGAELGVNGAGVSLTVAGPTTATDSDFFARYGGVILLPNLRSVTNNSQNVTWHADGTGALLDCSSLTNLTLGFYQVVNVQAYDGGKVDLQRLTNAPVALNVDARDAGSMVDLRGLTGRWRSLGYGPFRLEADSGASINIQNVTQLEYGELRVNNTGTITAQLNLVTNAILTADGAALNFGRLTNIDNTSLYTYNGGVLRLTNVFRVSITNENQTWHAGGTDGLIDLSSLTNLWMGYYQSVTVQAFDGAKVDLRRLATAPSSVNVDARDEGSVVDLSALSGRWKSVAYSPFRLEAESGATIHIPNVTQLEYGELRVNDSGTITTAQLNLVTNAILTADGSAPNFGRLTNIDNTSLYTYNGGILRLTNVFRVSITNENQTWHAAGAGGLLDLSSLTNLWMGYYQAVTVQAFDGAKVDLRRLATAPASVNVDARDAGSVVDLSALSGRWKSVAYSPFRLEAESGASIHIPNVTQLEYGELRVNDAGTITTAQLTLVTNAILTADGAAPDFGRLTNIDNTSLYTYNGGILRLTNVYRVSITNENQTWHAAGIGGLIDVSSLTNLWLGYYQALTVQAFTGGKVDLQRLAHAPASVNVDARNAGSQVNLNGLKGRWKSAAYSPIRLEALSGASISMPNVTQLEYAELTVADTGTITTAQLNLVTNAILTADGAAPNFGSLTNIDNTTLYADDGGVLRLTNVSSVSVSGENQVWRARDTGSLVDLSSLTNVSVAFYQVITVQALSGGKVDLRRLPSLSTGAVELTADGSGSVIDLRGLSGFISIGYGKSELTARNNGVILLNDQAFLLANVVISIPPGNPVLPPTLTVGSTLTLYGQPWHCYWIEKRDTRSSLNPWVFLARVPMTTSLQPILSPVPPNMAFRVWEFIADPPLLDLVASPDHQFMTVIYDTPGKTNQLLSATQLTPGATWTPGAITTMTNSFRILGPSPATDPVRFYRAKRL